jgi:hypothetical protein
MRYLITILFAMCAFCLPQSIDSLGIVFSDTRIKKQVTILQYNVKGGQGGWTTTHDIINKQVDIIAHPIGNSSVDFIALEQADEKAGLPGPIISEELARRGLKGWKTIVSVCNMDATQLAYSSNWTVIGSSNENPLLNGSSPQRGWIPGGCEHGNGRPYNIAYFKNEVTGLNLLVVIMHLPHCHERNLACVASWELQTFKMDIEKVIGATGDKSINLAAAGDMNELGDLGDPLLFSSFFPKFGYLKISPALNTCCADSHWKYRYDRVLSNTSGALEAAIVKDDDYPLNSGYLGRNEEHKAILASVVF